MNNINIFKALLLTFTVSILMSCMDEFLDREPLSVITPEVFYTEESQLAAFPVQFFGLLPSQTQANDGNYYNDPLCPGGRVGYFYVSDMWTDNQANFQSTEDIFAVSGSNRSVRVVSNDDRLFVMNNMLYQLNYFLMTTVPRMQAGTLTGNQDNIKHYIGEAYLMRAYRTFLSLVTYGDLPINNSVWPDDFEVLVEASKRQPRNEVARWILSDLDSAVLLMKTVSPDGRKQRPSKYVAQMVKSRVALFEATWLKYFKNTPFVPNGPGWPGAATHPGYQFPSGSIDAEINWFCQQAMDAAQDVADSNPLIENNRVLPQSTSESNRYFDMLCNATDYSG